MQCIILAAGKGTRLQPVTDHRSKAMAPVAGKPMVGRVVDMVRSAGIDRFVFVSGPDDPALISYAETLRRSGIAVDLVCQQERLGMAHALGLAAPYLSTPDFLLTACDNLVPEAHLTALVQAHRECNAAATLSLMHVEPERISATGIVDWQQGRILRIVEKPRPEDAPSDISSLPLYVFSRALLDLLPTVQPSRRGEYELQDAIQMLIAQEHLVTGVFTESRSQLTNCDDLLALNRQYLDPSELRLHGSVKLGERLALNAPALIDCDATVGPGCTIGPNVYLEPGARIGAGARIRNAIVLAGGQVSPGATIADTVVV